MHIKLKSPLPKMVIQRTTDGKAAIAVEGTVKIRKIETWRWKKNQISPLQFKITAQFFPLTNNGQISNSLHPLKEQEGQKSVDLYFDPKTGHFFGSIELNTGVYNYTSPSE